MGYTVPTTEPIEIVSGDLVTWKLRLDDYLPDDGWSLIYYLTRSTGSQSATATNAGDGYHQVTISTGSSAALTAGEWSYTGQVVKGTSERYTVRRGVVLVRANPTAGEVEDRDHVRRVLEALEATILGKASQDQLSYSIAGRSLSKMPPADLIAWRDTYRAEVRQLEDRERLARGESSRTRVRVKFG